MAAGRSGPVGLSEFVMRFRNGVPAKNLPDKELLSTIEVINSSQVDTRESKFGRTFT